MTPYLITIRGADRYVRFVRRFHDEICASTFAGRFVQAGEHVCIERAQMHDYDEATLQGMRKIIADKERADRARKQADAMRPYVRTPEEQMRLIDGMRNASSFNLSPEAFRAMGVKLPPLTLREKAKQLASKLIRRLM